MKVMQINAVYGVGSTGVIVEDLHKLSFSNGIDSYVSYSTTNKNPAEIPNGYKIGGAFGKKIHSVLSKLEGKQAYFSRFSTMRLIKQIVKVNPDVVHLHNLHSNYVHLNMLLNFLAKKEISTIITLHDCWFYTGGCFHYTSDKCFKWLEKCEDCPKRYLGTPAYLRDASSEILADRKKYFSKFNNLTIVGVSDWIADEARKSHLKKHEICTIHNGLDKEWFVNTPSDFREKYNLQDKFLILAVAVKWTNPHNKEFVSDVLEKLPEDCVVVMIGCKDEIKDSWPSNVLPLSYIKDRDELRKIYSACDVFANCTQGDSMSLINVEVQSCGTPIVTFRNTGAQETVDNKCSFSVETGNVNDFLDAIFMIKEKGKDAFSEDCHKWATENFDRDKNYLKYINLYKDKGGERC